MIYTLYHVHDPMCSWCYAFEPTFHKLRENLNDNIKVVHVVGGLAKHTDEPMSLDMRKKIENIWYEIQKEVGTNFNHDFWKNCTPKRSTYLACKATMIARDYNKEDEMIKAIQNAYYQRALNPSEVDTLVQLSKELEINENEFKEKLLSQEAEDNLQDELNLRRSLYVRSFPSLVLKYKKELYPINIKYNDYNSMLKQINDMVENSYF